jgi:hypothetical protein
LSPGNLAQIIFRLSNARLASSIDVSPEWLRVLSLVDGTRTVAEIARATRLDEAAVRTTLVDLHRAGVLEIVGVVDVMPDHANEPPPSTLDGRFFSQVELELARAIGPLAEIIVDDELAAMGEKRAGFHRDRAAELVERVSLAIRDETKRVKFQSAMLPEIRDL